MSDSTESMTVAEAKNKWRNGEITTNDASDVEPNRNGFDATFYCKNGYFTVTSTVVETQTEG